ncbi:hypothetical protein [Actinomadura macra]|uniref:hypothetical protein n=1 Tax=Actinomadura macra TaxID=46164 RepID=UPI000A43B1FA|nr:hypothetical protein [Actinomadura macra]
MPILHRTHQSDGSGAADPPPVRRTRRAASPPARARRLPTPPLTKWGWPATLVMFTTIVFVVFLIQSTLLMALVMAVATMLAGGILLTLVTGTAWIDQLRGSAAEPRRRH